MAINIQGGQAEPKKVVLEIDGQQAGITQDGALKVDSTHTIQKVTGEVEIANEVNIGQPIETKELNTIRTIDKMPSVKIDPYHNEVKTIIDEPLRVLQDDIVNTNITNNKLPIEGSVEVTNLPFSVNSDNNALSIEGGVEVTNLPSIQKVQGTVNITQTAGDRLQADVNIKNNTLPVATGDRPLDVVGNVTISPSSNNIGHVHIDSLPAVKLDNIATGANGRLQVDILSQPTLTMDEVKINPEWNNVKVSNWPNVQTVSLANNMVTIPVKVQENLKKVQSEITNIVEVRDLSDNKHVEVTNWPKEHTINGQVTLPYDTIQDLKVIQVDNFPTVQAVSIPDADIDSLGRFTVKVDKLTTPIKIDDSVPIRVDTELTLEEGQVNLDNINNIDTVGVLDSITNPVKIDDSTPIAVDVIGIDQVTFTNSSLDTHEQNAYDETSDRFKVTIEDDTSGLKNVKVVNLPLDVEVGNLPAIQRVDAVGLDIRPLTAATDKITAQIANSVLHVDDNDGSLTVDGMVDINNFPSIYPVTNDGKPLQIKGHVTSAITSAPTLKVTPDITKDKFPVVATELDIRQLNSSDVVSIEGGNIDLVNIQGSVDVKNLPDNQEVTVTNISLDAEGHIQADLVSLPAVRLDTETLAALENITVTVDNIPAVQDVNIVNQIAKDEITDHAIVDIANIPAIALDQATLESLENTTVSVDNFPQNQEVTVTNITLDEDNHVQTDIVSLPSVALDSATLEFLEHVSIDNFPNNQDVTITNQIAMDTNGHAQVDIQSLPDVVLDADTLAALEHTNVTVDNFPLNQDVTVTNIALDTDGHQQVDIVKMPSLPAGTNHIGSVDANITNSVLDVQGTVSLDSATRSALEHTTVTVDNIPNNQDVTVTNQIAKDATTGRAQIDIINMPSVTGSVDANIINEILKTEVTNWPSIQAVDLNNVNLDTDNRINVNINDMPVVKIDDSTPINVNTELYVDGESITMDKIDTINTLDTITNPVKIDDSTPIAVDVIGIDTVTIQSGTLNTHEENAYDEVADVFKVKIEDEPSVRDVNVVNTVLPVDGTVEITNFPTIQTVEAEDLDIRSLNSAQDSITATIDNKVLDVEITNWPSIQAVSGTIDIGKMPAVAIDEKANNIKIAEMIALPDGNNIIGKIKNIGSNYDEDYPDHNEIKVNNAGEQFVQITNLPDLQKVELTNIALDSDNHAQIDIVTLPDITGTVSVDNLPDEFNSYIVNQIAVDDQTNRAQIDIANPLPSGSNKIGIVEIDKLPSISGTVSIDNLPEDTVIANTEARDEDGHSQVDVLTLPPINGTVEVTNQLDHLDVTLNNQIAVDDQTSRAQVDIVNPLPAGDNLLGAVNINSLPDISGLMEITNLPENQNVTITNPISKDKDGHAQVDIVNTPTVIVENTTDMVADINHNSDSVLVYGNDGVTNRSLATDENGRVKVVTEKPKSISTIDEYTEIVLSRGEMETWDIVIPDGEVWIVEELGLTSLPVDNDSWNIKNLAAEVRLIWDPSGENKIVRRIGSGTDGGTISSSMNREVVGDGNKELRVVISNRGSDSTLLGTWINGYIQ